MKLNDFLKTENLRLSDLAKLSGVSVATLSRYVRGQRKLSAVVAAKISASTKGEVTICDLLYPEGAPENARLM